MSSSRSAEYAHAIGTTNTQSWVSNVTINLTCPQDVSDCEVVIILQSYYTTPNITNIPSGATGLFITDPSFILLDSFRARVARYNIDHLSAGQVIGSATIGNDNPSGMNAVIFYN